MKGEFLAAVNITCSEAGSCAVYSGTFLNQDQDRICLWIMHVTISSFSPLSLSSFTRSLSSLLSLPFCYLFAFLLLSLSSLLSYFLPFPYLSLFSLHLGFVQSRKTWKCKLILKINFQALEKYWNFVGS